MLINFFSCGKTISSRNFLSGKVVVILLLKTSTLLFSDLFTEKIGTELSGEAPYFHALLCILPESNDLLLC